MSPPDARFNLADYFVGEDRLSLIGERTAIEFEDETISYADLRAEVDDWAARLLERGVASGDRVAMLAYDSPAFIACFLAAASVAAISVPINTFLADTQVASIVDNCDARVVIADARLMDKTAGCGKRDVLAVNAHTSRTSEARSAQSRVRTDRATPAFLLYTSGSTGEPKGVLHLHGSIPFTVESYCANVLRLTPEDRIYSASRMFFAYGLGNSLSFPLANAATVLLDAERPTAERVARLLSGKRPTVFFGVPALYRALLDYAAGNPVDVSSVRLCVSAGEALPATIFEDWKRAFGLEIIDGIGSTEMLHVFISNREGATRAGSTGETVKGYEARLLDDAGVELAGEQTGALWIRGSSAMSGYWERPELTAQTLVDGWVRTGDTYRRDGAEFFYHLGRSDDCFKVHGLWVSPIEVESALLTHSSVGEAAVVPSVDEAGLATVRAFVVIRTGEANDRLSQDIKSHVVDKLSQYKIPTQIEFIGEMPRTSTGKIQRYKLRERGKANESDAK